MKHVIAALCCLMLAAPVAMAQDKAKSDDKKTAVAKDKAAKPEEKKKGPSEAQKKQQAKMKDCNKTAADKKLAGEERKKFMSTCLKG